MSSHLVIESIGLEEELRKAANSVDIAAIEHISNPNRRCEILAWRAIVRRELGAEAQIGYDEYGAPQITSSDKYISVSHSKGVVAVLIADAPCAVDIEHADRDFRKVSSRYLSNGELAMAEQCNLFAEMWCAKEALYKYYRRGNLDFAEHIRIERYNPAKHLFVATILDSKPIEVEINYKENLVVATTFCIGE